MTIVDKFVEQAIKNFPDLFGNRTEVLHHVFCVVGNGFEWDEGEPVDLFSHDAKEWTAEAYIAKNRAFISTMPEIVQSFLIEDEQEEVDRLQEIVDTAAKRAVTRGDIRGDICPQSNYSLLMFVPKDVLPEWEEAAEEMWAFAKKNGWIRPAKEEIEEDEEETASTPLELANKRKQR